MKKAVIPFLAILIIAIVCTSCNQQALPSEPSADTTNRIEMIHDKPGESSFQANNPSLPNEKQKEQFENLFIAQKGTAIEEWGDWENTSREGAFFLGSFSGNDFYYYNVSNLCAIWELTLADCDFFAPCTPGFLFVVHNNTLLTLEEAYSDKIVTDGDIRSVFAVYRMIYPNHYASDVDN